MVRWGRLIKWILVILILGGGGIAMIVWASVTWPSNVSVTDENGVPRSRDEIMRLNDETIKNSIQFKLMLTGLGLIVLAILIACMVSCCAERFISGLRPLRSARLREVRIHPTPEVFLSTQVSPYERPTLVVSRNPPVYT